MGIMEDSRRVPAALLLVLGTLTAISTLATDIYLPAMPVMAADLQTDALWIQTTLSAFILGMAAGQLCLGPLSDAVGRRWLLIGGSAIALIATVLVALAPNVEMLIIWRVLQGIGSAAGVVIGRAIVSDLADEENTARAFSILGLIGGVGPIIGPPVGGLILGWAAWPVIFWILAALCLIALLGVILLVPETLPAQNRVSGGLPAFFRSTAGLLNDRTFLSATLMMCFAVGATFAYIAASPFVIQTILGFDAMSYTIIFAINGIGLTLSGAIAAKTVGRVSETTLCRFGLSALTLGGTILLLATVFDAFTAWLVLPALFLIPTGMGAVFGPGTALVIRNARRTAGTAMALLGCGQFIFGSIAAPLGGVGGATESLPVALVIVISGAIALGLVQWLTATRSLDSRNTAEVASAER
ncbi:multidrug effflux MFS transporter [Microbacterium sp. A196]|uniref:multidrug effflux MFS transporter n=1 Tax=unclassified Microbacterium TaxID=2609290 RepID=UPI003FD0C4B7